MIILLSPSKTLDFETDYKLKTHTRPVGIKKSEILIKELRKFSPQKIASLMGISDKLAKLNADRYRKFKTPFTLTNARQALLAFKGDVYAPMKVESYTDNDFTFAQEHVRILSGLYGVLKPLDLIQPYRLEMGIPLVTGRGKSLYDFWGDTITKIINNDSKNHKNKYVINLSSSEYFHSVKPELLKNPLIHIVFKEKQKGALKIIGLFAKKARGMMTNFAIKNRIDQPAGLKDFSEGGYRFQPALSSEKANEKEWVWVR